MSVEALSPEEFETLLSPFLNSEKPVAVAVAVSGGPDSMALWYGLSRVDGLDLHPLMVDHGLRAESAEEATRVKEIIPNLKVLKWDHAGVEARVQEEARKARYDLMIAHCNALGIEQLFIAHHEDDQAETILFRFAKGSGLDGLAGMRERQEMDGVALCRPFLNISKARLIATCEAAEVSYLSDPSNGNEDYARVRLRRSREVLEEEGLSNKRLALTAKRIGRARTALERIADSVYSNAVLEINSNRIVLNLSILKTEPDEIILRCVLKAISTLRSAAEYAPRFEKVEALCDALLSEEGFRKRTLGGVVFEVEADGQRFSLMHEKP